MKTKRAVVAAPRLLRQRQACRRAATPGAVRSGRDWGRIRGAAWVVVHRGTHWRMTGPSAATRTAVSACPIGSTELW